MSEPDTTDRYATEWRLTGQVESEWGDVLLGEFLEASVPAAKRLGFATYLAAPPYHASAAQWLASMLAGHKPPTTCVDIGGGLGRFLIECLRQLPSLEVGTYVEPSPTLFRWTKAMLTPDAPVARTPFLHGVAEVRWHETPQPTGLDEGLVRKVRMLQGSADVLGVSNSTFDLVSVLNVLDQCAYPSLLAARALGLVAPGGYAYLSCTHQFQQRLFIDPATVFASLHELFSIPAWRFLAEGELPFMFRMGERHRNLFLSHHVLYQRVA